jgi:pyrroline-5-carboxylate reductase
MGGKVDLGHGRVLTVQTVAAGASSSQASSAFGSQTYQVRLVANTACHYKVGSGSLTATTGDVYLPANWVEYVMVNPGENIAAVEAATGGLVTATVGTLWVTELG